MRKKTALILAVILLLTAAGCGRKAQQPKTDYVLYFPPASNVSYGSALVAQAWEREEDIPPEAEEVLYALLGGPVQEGLSSPFPRGVYLVRTEWDAAKPGTLRVRLSEGYSGLSNIALTVADYSIVLSLSQLEGVEAVEIVSGSYSAGYRSRSTMRAWDAELVDPLLAEPTDS